MYKTRYFTVFSALFAAVCVFSAFAFAVQAAETEQQLIDVLKADSPKAEKAITCKKLAIYGGKDAVAELAKLLPDEQLNSWARIALEAIPGPEADAALRDAAGKLNGRILIGVINSIGVRRDAAAVDMLTARLADPDAAVAAAAALALGRIGNDSARAALEKALPTALPAVRETVAEGCVLVAERLANAGNSEAAAKLYDAVRTADVPNQWKAAATRGAILARGPAGVPLLVEQLKSDDKTMFYIGLTAARELPGSEATEALVSLLNEATPERRAVLIVALAERNDATVLPALLKAAQGGPKTVRIAALGMMPRLGNASCVEAVLQATLDADAEVAAAAKQSLAGLPGAEVDAKLAARLPQAQGGERLVLIDIVGLRRINAVAELLKAADDADPPTRAAALTALGETVAADNLPFLLERVVAPQKAEDTPFAQKALRAAAIRMPDREACAAALTAAVPRADMPTKIFLLEILGEVGGQNALAQVAAAAKDADAQIQDAASRVLGKWTTNDAAPVLLDLAATLPESKFKVRAMRGYIRIIRQSKLAEAEKLAMCRQALATASRVEEKALVLDTLPRFQSADSLALAAEALAFTEVREAAARAALAVAEKIVDAQPDAVAAAMQKLIAAGIQGDLLDQAKAMSARAAEKAKK